MLQHHHSRLYLCIDQGGHASRALVFDREGHIVAKAFESIEARHSENGHVEYNAYDLFHSISRSITAVLAQLGDRQAHIHSAGLATQRSNIVCWDPYSGQALSPIISWQDRRGEQWLKKFSAKAHQIHDKTGLFMSPHYGASKLRWCLDHLPEVKKAADENRLRFGPMSSYLIHHLVSERPCYTDPVNGGRTQLMNLETLDWDNELLELFDLPRHCLPDCVPNHYNYGTLINSNNIPLRLVTGDQASAMYAYGKIQPNTAYINMGTGAFLSRPSGNQRITSRRLLTSLIRQQSNQGEYVLESTVNGASSALEWFANEYRIPDLIEKLPLWLAESKHKTVFLNAIAGLGAPFWISDFASEFEGEDDLIGKATAVAESIVFLLQAGLEEMCKFASPPEQIQITGGLSQMNGLCQRIANLSHLPVYRPRDCEATARGLAFLLAGSPSYWPEEEIGEWFEAETDIELKNTYNKWMSLMLAKIRKY